MFVDLYMCPVRVRVVDLWFLGGEVALFVVVLFPCHDLLV